MKKFILISILIVAIGICLASVVYINAMNPVKEARELAYQKVKDETSLVEVDDFSLYHGQETYYVVKGKEEDGTSIYVWVPEKEGKIIVLKQADGITEQEAINKLKEEKNPKEIISVRLGIEKGRPLWEMYYRSDGDLINYYYVEFKTGDWLKTIENL